MIIIIELYRYIVNVTRSERTPNESSILRWIDRLDSLKCLRAKIYTY